jgi:ATP-binding cassette subfamily F protein 3
MLSVHQVSKRFNINDVLIDVSFNLNPDERIGLIGPNGCGKTTLLNIVAGETIPDHGVITRIPKDLKIGYLQQSFQFHPKDTLGEIIDPFLGDFQDLEKEISNIAAKLVDEPDREDLQFAYDNLLTKIKNKTIPSIHPQVILEIFGLAELPENKLVSSLSGGQKSRLALAVVMLGEPDILILDEPTNHLDITILEWLESWLKRFNGGMIIVSHDRTFLDHIVTRILDLDPDAHTITEYHGNYSDYLQQFIQKKEKQLSAYRDQQYEIRRIKQDIARTKQQAYRVEITTTSRQPGLRRYAKKVARKAKSREKKLNRYLDSDERIEKPRQSWQLRFEFTQNEHKSQDVLRIEGLFAGYPNNQPLIENLSLHIKFGDRIALIGPNGSGKTTLLKIIVGIIKPISGRIHLGKNIKLGYMAQEQESLAHELTPLEIIQAQTPIDETEARSFLHFFLFSGDDALRKTDDLSFGERARLELARLVIQGCNFLLLDEPINHLDIPSRSRFEQALTHFDGTVLAVVHDRYFIKKFATQIWILENSSVRHESADIFE